MCDSGGLSSGLRGHPSGSAFTLWELREPECMNGRVVSPPCLEILLNVQGCSGDSACHELEICVRRDPGSLNSCRSIPVPASKSSSFLTSFAQFAFGLVSLFHG